MRMKGTFDPMLFGNERTIFDALREYGRQTESQIIALYKNFKRKNVERALKGLIKKEYVLQNGPYYEIK